MSKSTRVDIMELSPEAVQTRLSDPAFSSVAPCQCEACGSTSGFNRRLFKIKGLPKEKWGDEGEQNLLRERFRTHPLESIESIFFRTYKKDLYVDTANCKNCRSTRITYDISFTEEKLAALAKAAGTDPATFKAQVDAMANKIARR